MCVWPCCAFGAVTHTRPPFLQEGVEFDSLYAMMIARRLPRLPDGVDPNDVWVQRALREIIFRAGDLLALDTVREQEVAVQDIEGPLKAADALVDEKWAKVLELEEAVAAKAESVAQSQKEFNDASAEFKAAYMKVVRYWREDAPGAGEAYQEAIARLQSLIPLDWELMAKSWEVNGVSAGSRAIRLMCDAINDFFNRHPPSFTQARMLCQNAGDNADMGDKEAVYHDYNVLMMHLVESLDPFALCDSDKPERVTRYMSQPDFHADCADYHAVSDAPGAMMNYLLAAQRFIMAARGIEKERQTVQRLTGYMKVRQSVLYLEQERLSQLRREVVEAQREHRDAVRDASLVLERKEELVKELEGTRQLIRTGKMPPPRKFVNEYAQNRALAVFDSRVSAPIR